MSNETATENDATYAPGHAPDCNWDEVRARVWCSKACDDRYAKWKAARKAARKARWGF